MFLSGKVRYEQVIFDRLYDIQNYTQNHLFHLRIVRLQVLISLWESLPNTSILVQYFKSREIRLLSVVVTVKWHVTWLCIINPNTMRRIPEIRWKSHDVKAFQFTAGTQKKILKQPTICRSGTSFAFAETLMLF